MIRAAALGLLFVVTTLLTACGLVVTDEAPTTPIEVAAPALTPAVPEVDALAFVPSRVLSRNRARALSRRAALPTVIPACDDESQGRGFAIDAHTLVAHRDVIEGGGYVRVWAGNRSTAVGAASAYRVGELAVAQVARTDAELRATRSRQAALTSVTADLNACAEGLETVVRTPKTKPVVKRASLARCGQARASLRSYLQGAG